MKQGKRQAGKVIVHCREVGDKLACYVRIYGISTELLG